MWASTWPTEHLCCNEGLTDAGEVQQQVNCADVEMAHRPPANNVLTPKYKTLDKRSQPSAHTHTDEKICHNSNMILHDCLLENTYWRWLLSKVSMVRWGGGHCWAEHEHISPWFRSQMFITPCLVPLPSCQPTQTARPPPSQTTTKIAQMPVAIPFSQHQACQQAKLKDFIIWFEN